MVRRIAAVRVLPARCALRGVAWLLLWILAIGANIGCGKRPTTQPLVTPQNEPGAAPGEDVTIELDEAQKADLAARAQRDLEETAAIIGALDRERLSPEQREKLRSVEGLVAASKDAGQRDDVAAMANLARKARLLANDLVPG